MLMNTPSLPKQHDLRNDKARHGSPFRAFTKLMKLQTSHIKSALQQNSSSNSSSGTKNQQRKSRRNSTLRTDHQQSISSSNDNNSDLKQRQRRVIQRQTLCYSSSATTESPIQQYPQFPTDEDNNNSKSFINVRSTPIFYPESIISHSSSTSSPAASVPVLATAVTRKNIQSPPPPPRSLNTEEDVDEEQEQSICSAHSFPATISAIAATTAISNNSYYNMRFDALTPHGASSSSAQNQKFYFSTPHSISVERRLGHQQQQQQQQQQKQQPLYGNFKTTLSTPSSYFPKQPFRFFSRNRGDDNYDEKDPTDSTTSATAATRPPWRIRMTGRKSDSDAVTKHRRQKQNNRNETSRSTTNSSNNSEISSRSRHTFGSWRQRRIQFMLKEQQFPDFETEAFCEVCEKYIQTRIRYRNGAMVWLMSFILLLCTVILFWLPFYVKYFKDVAHFCPGCGKCLGVLQRV